MRKIYERPILYRSFSAVLLGAVMLSPNEGLSLTACGHASSSSSSSGKSEKTPAATPAASQTPAAVPTQASHYNKAQGRANAALGEVHCTTVSVVKHDSVIDIKASMDKTPQGMYTTYDITSSKALLEGEFDGTSGQADATKVGYGAHATVTVHFPWGTHGDIAGAPCGGGRTYGVSGS